MNNENPDDGTQSEPSEINSGLPPMLFNPDQHDQRNLEHTDPIGLVRLNEFWSYDPRSHMIGQTSFLEGLDHTKLERQASAFAAKVNAGGWTVIIEYFATGEGTHVWYQRVHGGTKIAAIANFRETFFANDSDEAWAFWSIGMTVYEGSH
jgi:hypothetical protein